MCVKLTIEMLINQIYDYLAICHSRLFGNVYQVFNKYFHTKSDTKSWYKRNEFRKKSISIKKSLHPNLILRSFEIIVISRNLEGM